MGRKYGLSARQRNVLIHHLRPAIGYSPYYLEQEVEGHTLLDPKIHGRA